MASSLCRIGICLSFFTLLILAGCASTPTQDANIVFQGGNTRSVDIGQSIVINADVSNNNGQGLTWTCSGACSTSNLAPQPSTQQVVSILFKATATGTAIITATANQEPTVKSSITITIINAPSLPGGTLAGATVGTAYSQSIGETGGTAPFTYTVTSGSLPPGLTLNSTSGVISGTPTGSSSGQFTFTVTVKDSSSPGLSASQQYTISLQVPVPPLTITTVSPLPNASAGIAYTTSIAATGGVTPYTFSLDQSSALLPAGLSFSATSTSATISGIPTTVGTTTGIVVDVKDSSAGGAVQKATYSLTVVESCGSGSETLLNGNYAILVKGFDNGTGAGETAPQPVLMGGILLFDGNGNVAQGTFDVNSHSTAGIHESGVTGTYQIGSDQRGCMTLTTDQGTKTFRISLSGISSGVASVGHIVEFDTAGPFTSGVLLQQDMSAFSSTVISGNWVFGMWSPQGAGSPDGGKIGEAGLFNLTANADGSDGTVTGASIDVNNEGQLDGSNTAWSATTPFSLTGSANTYYVGYGIGNIIYNFTLNSNNVQVQNQIYVVSANEFLIMSSTDQTQSSGIFGAGVAFKQSTSSFSSNSLNGTSVLHTSGLEIKNPAPDTATTGIGTLTSSGSGTLNLSAWQNNGEMISPLTWSGSVQVAANGRVVFLTGGGSNPPLLWLINNNQGFYLGADADVESGLFEPQTATTVSSGSPYSFGSVSPEVAGADQEIGIATLSSGNITGTTDDNLAGTLSNGNAITKTYSVDANGLGSVPSGCTIGTLGTGGCQQIFYVISGTKAVLMNLQTGAGQIISTPVQIANQ